MKRIPVDNYIGCLLGGAIGDALGASIEFMDIDEIKTRYGDQGITDFVEFSGNSGKFTSRFEIPSKIENRPSTIDHHIIFPCNFYIYQFPYGLRTVSS
jgi:hypothetical protein